MKSSEFITEDNFNQFDLHQLSDHPDTPEVGKVNSIEHLAQIINKNCSQMVAAYRASSKVLLRGMKSHTPVVITNIRPDRRPVEMDKGVHKKLHLAFQKAGLTATRMNSIFCTTAEDIASDWGSNVYVIFVKNGWTGTVFTKFPKGYSYYAMYRIGNRSSIQDQADEISELGPVSFNHYVGLTGVLNKGYEDILITGSSYIAVKAKGSNFVKLMELLKIGPARNL